MVCICAGVCHTVTSLVAAGLRLVTSKYPTANRQRRSYLGPLDVWSAKMGGLASAQTSNRQSNGLDCH